MFFVALMLSTNASAQSLDELIRDGTIQIVEVAGNGSSSGAALDGVLRNLTAREVKIDVNIREPIFFRNSGERQNMIATQIYRSGGNYNVMNNRSFISIPSNSQINVMFIAYCADFDLDNPSSTDRFTVGTVPSEIRSAAVRIAAFEAENPNLDTTVASQVALWLAAGVSADNIRTQFSFNQSDLSLAQRILQ